MTQGLFDSVGEIADPQSTRRQGLGQSVLGAIPGIVAIVLLTVVCYVPQLNFTITGFLYLIAVVFQSLLGDFVSSAIVSIFADLCLNFFFVPPILSFRVSDSSDTWALVSFLVTGLVITRLTTRVRREARVSELQRQQMKMLYELAQRLLEVDPKNGMLSKSIALFRTVVGLRSTCLFDGMNAELHGDPASAQPELAVRTRSAYISRQDNDDPPSGIFARPLRVAGTTIGAVGFDGLYDADLTAGPLTALAAAMLERVSAFREATQADATAQAEVLRGAILDALAHEFKTPLATIMTAAGALRETAGLRPKQLELAEMAEFEAARLARLTSRLLRMARLDSDEIKPQVEPTDLVEMVKQLVEEYAERWGDRKLSVTAAVSSIEIVADDELLSLALRQLLDNACKYSDAGSEIKVAVDLRDDKGVVRVWNSGDPIESTERARVFDRFFRGNRARRTAPGSGLGLYVARKIAQAHKGTLELDADAALDGQGAAFRLVMPASLKSESVPQATRV
jgi:two-component system, OmpR family, sensor histidine kinase KdpD